MKFNFIIFGNISSVDLYALKYHKMMEQQKKYCWKRENASITFFPALILIFREFFLKITFEVD